MIFPIEDLGPSGLKIFSDAVATGAASISGVLFVGLMPFMTVGLAPRNIATRN